LKPEIWAEPWGLLGWGAVGTILVGVIGGGIGKWAGLI